MPTVSTTNERTFYNYFYAVENGLRDIVNVLPATWNGVVSSVNSLQNGTYLQDLSNEASAMAGGIKQAWSMPVMDQLAEATSPNGVRSATSMIAGAYVLPKVNIDLTAPSNMWMSKTGQVPIGLNYPAAKMESLFSLRGGYGVFGKTGLKVGNYRIDLMYSNPAAGQGAGTNFP